MALPSPGNPISMDMIRAELGIPSQAPFSLDAARQGAYVPLNPYSSSRPPSSGPVSLASWYNYCHTCTTLYTHTVYKAGNTAGLQNFVSAAAACFGTRDFPWTVVNNSPTISVGDTLYTLNGSIYEPFLLLSGAGEEPWAYSGTEAKPFRLIIYDSNVNANMVDAIGACGSGTLYNVRYNNNVSTICGEFANDVYTAGTWGTGTTVYTDASLTTPLTGYTYIVETSAGVIYNINPSTGVIGSDTGLNC